MLNIISLIYTLEIYTFFPSIMELCNNKFFYNL